MKRIAAVLLAAALLFCTGCSTGKGLPSLTEAPFLLCGTEDGLDAFLAKNSDYKGSGLQRSCRNITPDFVKEHSELQIFKYGETCDSFLLWQDRVLPLGTGFGGLGITSMALADLNQDGAYELYFTYSFGSGIHRSMLGAFDPSEEKLHQPEEVCWNEDTALTVDEQGELLMCRAEITDYTDPTALTATPLEPRYRVAWKEGKPVLTALADASPEPEGTLP